MPLGCLYLATYKKLASTLMDGMMAASSCCTDTLLCDLQPQLTCCNSSAMLQLNNGHLPVSSSILVHIQFEKEGSTAASLGSSTHTWDAGIHQLLQTDHLWVMAASSTTRCSEVAISCSAATLPSSSHAWPAGLPRKAAKSCQNEGQGTCAGCGQVAGLYAVYRAAA